MQWNVKKKKTRKIFLETFYVFHGNHFVEFQSKMNTKNQPNQINCNQKKKKKKNNF